MNTIEHDFPGEPVYERIANGDLERIAPGQGGDYVIEDGRRIRVGQPTQDHPEGNTARDASGRKLSDIEAELAKTDKKTADALARKLRSETAASASLAAPGKK
jgi:hypothetical protein